MNSANPSDKIALNALICCVKFYFNNFLTFQVMVMLKYKNPEVGKWKVRQIWYILTMSKWQSH